MADTTQKPMRGAQHALNSSLIELVVIEPPLPPSLAACELSEDSALLKKLRDAYRAPVGTVTEVAVSETVEVSVKTLERGGASLELALVDTAADDIKVIWEGYRAYPKGALKAIARVLGVSWAEPVDESISSVERSGQNSHQGQRGYSVDPTLSPDSIWAPIVVGWTAKRAQAGNVVEITIDEVSSSKGRFRATLLCPSQPPHISYFDDLLEAKQTCLHFAGLLLDFTD